MTLSNAVECAAAYGLAGQKGQPEGGTHKGRKGRRRRRKGQGGRGTMEKERPPVFGMMERGGQGGIHVLANVQQQTSEPLMQDPIASGTWVDPDAYRIDARLETGGYAHKSVNPGRGACARAEEGDGFGAGHVHTMAGL